MFAQRFRSNVKGLFNDRVRLVMVSFVYIPPGHAVGEEGAHTPGARLGFKGEVTT